MSLAGLLGWAVDTGREAHRLARRRRMRSLRLTVTEREACADELAEQYALGRLDEAELGHRVDLLHRSDTHGDLEPVFDGLPMPSIYAPAVRPGRWRWFVFAIAAWLAVPLVLIGTAFAASGREVIAAVFGLPALMWVLLLWRWASATGRPSGRTPGAQRRRR